MTTLAHCVQEATAGGQHTLLLTSQPHHHNCWDNDIPPKKNGLTI